MKKTTRKIYGMAMTLMLGATSAHATLIGDTVDIAIVTVNGGGPIIQNSQQVVVSEGITELTGFGPFDVNIEADTLTALFNRGGVIDNIDFAGLAFLNLDFGNPGQIVGFLGGDTNIAGFGSSRVLFDEHNVAFNFSGLTINQGDYVTVQLDIRNEIPAPATLPLLGIGFAAFAALRSKKQQRQNLASCSNKLFHPESA